MAPFATAVILAAISPYLPQPVVIGPFNLGDLMLSSPNGDWLIKQSKDGGLDIDEVKKKMNGWKGHIVVQRMKRPDGKWDWPQSLESKLLVEGRMSIELKNSKGDKVEIALTEANLAMLTTLSGWGRGGEPPSVQCSLSFTFR
ncbi:MAG TPA: hypothetical protein VGL71_10050 [Urbifossiella sp.]|jgi:hypothetical protein